MTQETMGRIGEARAVTYLKSRGYIILERNWRVGHREIDIICLDGSVIVIVEVKTREAGTEYPAELMDRKKKQNLLRAGAAYLQLHKLQNELRFDLVVVKGKLGPIEHIQEAIQVFD